MDEDKSPLMVDSGTGPKCISFLNILVTLIIATLIVFGALILFPVNQFVSDDESTKDLVCDDITPIDRFDCNPDKPSQKTCESRECCWRPISGGGTERNESSGRLTISTPFCYYPRSYKSYTVTKRENGNNKITVTLTKTSTPSGYPNDIQSVIVEITYLCDYRLRIKIIDALNDRWEVPLPTLNLNKRMTTSERVYDVKVTDGGRLTVIRKSTGAKVFDTDLTKMIYSDQLIQLSTLVPSKSLYGLGEHMDSFRKNLTSYKMYTMLNYDAGPTRNAPLYGTHPFYLMVEDDERASSHGILLFNNNPQDILIQPTPAVTFRTIGGILDFFILLGPTPDEVIKQNVQLVGTAPLPPFWSLGFHLCKYGYGSLNRTMEIWNQTRNAGIPFDVQWNDIDYMDRQNDFTYDTNKYSGLPQFVNQLHSVGMKYVMIIDPAVSGGEPLGTYPPFDEGLKMDIFIKNSSGQIFVGKVWNPVASVFPDFTHPNAESYWTKQIKSYYDKVPFDGIWIDMNEPSNFWDGQKDGCTNTSIDKPPYIPGLRTNINSKTVCMSAKQYLGQHYNLHNMYGIFEAKATHNALMTIRKKRPFIISRSTVTGFGNYANHWSGDISSNFDYLRMSIPNMLNFNLFGIPMVGADICGFNGNSNPELCSRWTSLGAFYPFSRNHNEKNTIDQDPVSMGPKVVAAAQYSLGIRYSLLPYLYTMFYENSVNGKPVARSLFFSFPLDKGSYGIEDQFMWGNDVMIIPVVEEGASGRVAYLPPGKWYDYTNKTFSVTSDNGVNLRMDIPLDKIKVMLRGGSVIPVHVPKQTTTEQRRGNFSLIVSLDGKNESEGQLYWDDGDSLGSDLLQEYSLIKFTVADSVLTSEPVMAGYHEGMILSNVTILGLFTEFTREPQFFVDGVDIPSHMIVRDRGYLTLTNLDKSLLEKFNVTWKL